MVEAVLTHASLQACMLLLYMKLHKKPQNHCPHLLVDLCAVVEAVLTSASHTPLQAGRVPRAHARHLAQTTMGLAGQAGHTPTGHHALGTATLQT
jgi:hypothetical protein